MNTMSDLGGVNVYTEKIAKCGLFQQDYTCSSMDYDYIFQVEGK